MATDIRGPQVSGALQARLPPAIHLNIMSGCQKAVFFNWELSVLGGPGPQAWDLGPGPGPGPRARAGASGLDPWPLAQARTRGPVPGPGTRGPGPGPRGPGP